MSKLKIVVVTLSLFVLGFFREFLFENINGQLYYLWKEESNPYLPKSLFFLDYISYWNLYYGKFILILLFSILYLYGSLVLVKLFFKERLYRKFTMFFFGGIFLLAALIFALGIPFGAEHEAYGISRKLIEFIQSPLAGFFLIPAFALYKKEKT